MEEDEEGEGKEKRGGGRGGRGKGPIVSWDLDEIPCTRLTLSNMMPNKMQGWGEHRFKKTTIHPDVTKPCLKKKLLVISCLVLGYPAP